MEKKKILAVSNSKELGEVLVEMNEEIERLKKFAKNFNAFGGRIFPDMINISEDKK